MPETDSFQKLYVIAGEDSGDLHAANLIKELKQRRPNLQVRGMGGEQMRSAGCELTAHISEGNFMGFVEVVKHLGTIRELFRRLRADATDWKPDAVLLVDYPGFNLRMAPFFKEMGVKVFYYISPQLWAWKKGRIRKIRQYVDHMMVILPFEKEFYRKEGVEVSYVGHPLLDAIGPMSDRKPESDLIALLPGSRKQEISRMLPVMLSLVKEFPEYRFVIGGAPSQELSYYQSFVKDVPVEIWMNRTYELLTKATAAAVTSGTATLEAGLFGVPQVVCYKSTRLSYEIGKRLVKVRFISLVNLIMDREVVTELIQVTFTPKRLLAEMKAILSGSRRQQLEADYKELHQKLGDAGASANAAESILSQFESS